MGVHDLKFNLHICDALGFEQPWVTHERGRDTFCASHGVPAMEDIGSNRRAPWRRQWCAHFELRRFVRVMAFAQLTWRESLRDIEICLTANQAKLFHMGMKGVPARSKLADALSLWDWRFYHALAMRLI